ncbi:hypothetical protein BB561_000872 [Smittium simulii]|uniref:1,3-beta-glucanosyltransferase n=1 Tax=Smittium simulii TaxID=133385 RepID=A0A2T9YXA7_9FUNG|nr:hypothetical protein BB561_000872 [Smittium simulii]
MKLSTVFTIYSLATTTCALDKIVIKGSKFFNSISGDQFFIKGLAYQPEKGDPTPAKQDPLANPLACERDAPLIKELGVNTIRVYQTDSSNDHDDCVKAFADNGIYLMLDIASASMAIDRDDPSWYVDLFAGYRNKIDAFAKYDNVIGFIAGNEVANNEKTTPSAAFVKAAIRDVKEYLAKNKLDFPVGYASNDEPTIRDPLMDYFNCGDDASARADFYGANLYSWCGSKATFSSSGYDKITEKFKDYSIPVLLSEYGCIAERPRPFNEAKSLYGSDMSATFSGGFMYMFTEEENNYGIVDVTYSSSELKKLEEFDIFKNVLSKVSPTGVKMKDYNSSNKIQSCPSPSEAWKVKSTELPQTPSTKACECMVESLGCALSKDFTIENPKAAQALLKDICSSSVKCDPIEYDTSKGTYGAFQFCNLKEKLSWALNAQYELKGKNADSCTVDGFNTDLKKSPSVSDISTCATKENDIGMKSSNTGSTSSSGSKNTSKSDSKNTSKSDSENTSNSSSDSGSKSNAAPNYNSPSIFSHSMAGFAICIVALVTIY